MSRLYSTAAVAVALVLLAAVPAAAQDASTVAAGAAVDVSNGTECRPNADVVLFFEAPGAEPRQVGTTVADAAGHFDASVTIPADAPTGDASVVVDCGLDQAVLTYRLVVTGAAGLSSGSAVQIAAVAIAIVALAGLVVVLRRRTARTEGAGDTDTASDAVADAATDGVIVTADGQVIEPVIERSQPADASAAAAAPGAVIPAGAASVADPRGAGDAVDPGGRATPGDHADDDADYWFWETTTPAGPVRRIACMSATTFHLHEVGADQFQPLLDRLVADGPDATLASAFVRIPVDAIAGVRHAGTVVHIDHTTPQGRATRTVDLGGEFASVVEILARRVPVAAVGVQPAASH